jgi:CheY-like chemotaxis protein
LLEPEGHEVEVANNGREALEMFKGGGFDVILMDVQMPRLDGLEAARRLVQEAPPQLPPILGLTAHTTPEDRESCLAAGMREYLAKPVVVEDLHAALERVTTPT